MSSRRLELAEQKAPAAWDAIKRDSSLVVARIRSMIVNGKKLNDNEVMALTAYSLANDLNPFNGEAYFIPGSGPSPGIAGYRKKARQQVRMEARDAKLRAPYFVEDYRLITDPAEAGHDPDEGDIAYECTVKDNVSLQGHADVITDAMTKLINAGVEPAAALEAAEKMVGKPPGWTGVGVVYNDEKFSRSGRDSFNRHERAKKRAAKLAIKKRFPSLDLPTSVMDDFGEDPIISVEAPEPEKELDKEEPVKTEAEILNELGFESEVVTATVVDEVVTEPTTATMNKKRKPTRPYNPGELKNRLQEKVSQRGVVYASKEQRGLLAGLLSEFLKDETKRHIVQKWLFGEASSKKINDPMVVIALEWLHYSQDSGGAYTISPMARKELSKVYDVAIKDEGQQSLGI